MDLSGSKRPSVVAVGGEEEQGGLPGGEEEATPLCGSGRQTRPKKDGFLIGLFPASAAPSVSAANGLSRRSNLRWRAQIQQSATLTRRQVSRHGCREAPVLPVA